MSGIAEVLLNLGYRISGSDLKLTPITERLALTSAAVLVLESVFDEILTPSAWRVLAAALDLAKTPA